MLTLAANRAYRSLGEGARTIQAHRQLRIVSTDLVKCAWASTSTSPVTWPQNPHPNARKQSTLAGKKIAEVGEMKPDNSRIMTIRELADYLRVPPITIYAS
jgi:hypothetical protein